MSGSYLVIELNHQPVELCKLLKIANLVGGGGEAKIVISEGYVLLNGEVEYQKRKKVYHEDVIEFNGEIVQLQINESLSQQPSTLPTQDTYHHTDTSDAVKQTLEQETECKQPATPKKRRPIAF